MRIRIWILTISGCYLVTVHLKWSTLVCQGNIKTGAVGVQDTRVKARLPGAINLEISPVVSAKMVWSDNSESEESICSQTPSVKSNISMVWLTFDVLVCDSAVADSD